jgi:L-arabinokinase
LLLYTPFSGDLCAFPHQQAIPLICRKSFLTKEEARLRAGLPLDRKILLISFGGLGLNEHFPLEPDISGDVILLFNPKREGLKYQDLVKAVDAVLTKPGYGIVSECIANRTPILYVDRGLFPEFDILDKEMGKYIPAQKIPLQDFFTGRWKPYWDKLLDDRTEKSSISLEGAEKAVQIFLDFY